MPSWLIKVNLEYLIYLSTIKILIMFLCIYIYIYIYNQAKMTHHIKMFI